MYKTMRDMQRERQQKRHEEHEVEAGFRELKFMRRSIAFRKTLEELQHKANERRKRWRAYRTR